MAGSLSSKFCLLFFFSVVILFIFGCNGSSLLLCRLPLILAGRGYSLLGVHRLQLLQLSGSGSVVVIQGLN